MQTVLRYDKRAGRFGREIHAQPAISAADIDGDGWIETIGYEIDVDAVASAIVERMLAGRTWPGGR